MTEEPVSLEWHLARLLGTVAPLEPLGITLTEARDCQLADDVLAPRPMPHFASALIDGLAVRTRDLTGDVVLKLVDHVRSGYRSSQPVYAGVAVQVDRGALLPTGADAIVPLTAAAQVATGVRVTGGVAVGHGIRQVGSLAQQGQPLLKAGQFVGPRTIGLLAWLGMQRVLVRPRPRVVIVTIGAGLLPLGATLTEGLAYDATGAMLTASAEQSGAVGYKVGPVDDDARSVRDTLEDQFVRADLLVVVGGIEGGSHEARTYLTGRHGLIYDEGTTNLGVFGHGTVAEEQIPCLSLPADPTRAAVLFDVLARPIVAAMRGAPAPPALSVRLSVDVPRQHGVTQVLLAEVPDGNTAVPSASGSPSLLEYQRADVLVRILPGEAVQPAGSAVAALRLDRPGGFG